MDNPEELVALGRDLAEGVVHVAGDLLSAGVEIPDVQRRYVTPAVELLADAETFAVQAVSGDEHALAALVSTVAALARLRQRAEAELNRSRGA